MEIQCLSPVNVILVLQPKLLIYLVQKNTSYMSKAKNSDLCITKIVL